MPPTTAMRPCLALLASFMLVAACDNVTSPTEPNSSGPVNLIGTYQAASFWTATVSTSLLTLYSRSCPGKIVVESQTDSNWAGSFATEPNCPVESGKVHGTVDAAGKVTLLFDDLKLPGSPYSAAACAVITVDLVGDPGLTGKVAQGLLELEFETTAHCQEPPLTAKLKLLAKGARLP